MTTSDLAAKLAELRALDADLPASTPVSPAEVAQLEAALGVVLPTPYRSFLTEVGTGAGLLSVSEILALDPADDMPLTAGDSVIRDSLVIASLGLDDVKLVTSGELAGTVWESGAGYWTPVASTFDGWYDAWLTARLREQQHHQRG